MAGEDIARELLDASIEEIAPDAELGAEGGDAILRPFKRADAAELDDRRDVARRVEKHLLRASANHRILDRHVAQTQPRHRIRLAERVDRDCFIVYRRQRGDAYVPALEDYV